MKKAVFEELNGDIAVFIVDDVKKPYHLDVSELPAGILVGDVFEVELASDQTLKLGEILPEERKRREEVSRSKREQLLKRKRKE
jgi:hypothetical protein